MGKSKRKVCSKPVSVNSDDNFLPNSVQHKIQKHVMNLLEICGQLPPKTSKDLWDEFLKIFSIIESLIELEHDKEMKFSLREDKFDEFCKWTETSGLSSTCFKIDLFDGEWGLRAEKEIMENEIWLEVPKKIMVSLESALNSDLGEWIRNDHIMTHLPSVALGMHILNEALQPQSFWKPYINILPSEFNTVLYFNKEEFAMLRNSPVFDDAVKQFRNIARQYAYFWKHLHNSVDSNLKRLSERFTYNAYRWCVSVVMTRQNLVPSSTGGAAIPALIPLWDMCNHRSGKITTNFNEDLNQIECFAMEDFRIGDQIFIHYGNRTNGEFFLHNGFVDPTNIYDAIKIKLGVSKNDPLFPKKQELLSRAGLDCQVTFSVTPSTNLNFPGPDILAFSRIFCMDSESLANYMDKDESQLKQFLSSHPEDTELDKKASNFLRTRIALLLSSYEATEKDVTSLQDQSQRAKLAAQLRHCEKTILKGCLEFSKSN